MIEVPEDFRRNGIGVVGDQVAEILYFKVARYFDRTDLGAESVSILFEWNLSNDLKNPDPYILPNYLKDIESEPGYIIFGCPINDRITKTSGTKEVSVKFIKGVIEDDMVKSIEYSLNTIPVRVAINNGLNLFQSVAIDRSVNDLINSRFQNSEASSAQVQEPVILLTNINQSVAYLKELDKDSKGKPMLYISAASPNAGSIEYFLYKNNEKLETIPGEEYIITLDEKKDIRKSYYIKNDEENRYDKVSDPDFSKKEEHPIYEKIYTFNFDDNAAGEYKIQVVNKVGYDSDGEGTKDKVYQRSIYTKTIKIPYPSIPSISPSADDEMTQKIYEQNEEKEFIDMVLSPIYEVANDELSKDAYLTYKWYKNEEEVPNSNTASLTVKGSDEQAMSTDTEHRHEYKVAVYNHLHGAITSEPVYSGIYSVSYLPSEFTTAEITGSITMGGTVSLTYALRNDSRSDNVTCKWYIDDIEMSNSNDDSKTFNIPSTGNYAGSNLKCVAINEYNGKSVVCAESLIPNGTIGKKQ